jgi:hypothetical protein
MITWRDMKRLSIDGLSLSKQGKQEKPLSPADAGKPARY